MVNELREQAEARVLEEQTGLVLLSLKGAKAVPIVSEGATHKAVTAEGEAAMATIGGGSDAAGFRRLTSSGTLRDLSPVARERMQMVCYYLRVTTPFGKRIVEIITSYSVGKGVRVTAKDARVQVVLDAFWNDDINDLDTQLPQWCDELTTFGELCLPIARREADGFVRIGYADPTSIDSIQFGQMDTAFGTAAVPVAMGVKLRLEAGEKESRVLPMVRRCEDPNDSMFGKLQGEVFYHAINRAKSASRGFSELFNLADWIDVFDQMVFDFADKVRLLNAFVWHYTLEGGDEKRVSEYKDKLTKEPPRQGGLHVTNERIKIEAHTPDFKGGDMAEVASMVKKYGLGGAGLPGTFFADGDDANRAAALEMNAPAVKKFQDRQNSLNALLTRILAYVIESAQLAGTLPDGIDTTFTIEFPEIAVRDLQKGAQMLQGLSAALTTAAAEGWVTGATAARAFHTLLAEVGVDIDDSQQEYKDAQDEAQERARTRQNDLNPQENLAAALAKAAGGGGAPSGDPVEPQDKES